MPLEDGIYRYTEDDVASPTISDLLNLLGDSIRARLAGDDIPWTPVALAAGYTATVPVEVCRIGGIVYWRGSVGKSSAWTSTYQLVIRASGMPAWAIPSRNGADAAKPISSGVATAQALAYIPATGVNILNASTTGTVHLAALSGYPAS